MGRPISSKLANTKNFLQLAPHVEIILNIDADHLDYFKIWSRSSDRLKVLYPSPRRGEFVVANSDNTYVPPFLMKLRCNVITFGLNEPASSAANIQYGKPMVFRPLT